MYGFGQAVVKLHGFGTGPGTSGRPALSFPDGIRTGYPVHGSHGAAWDNVRPDSEPSHVPVRATPPVIVHATEDAFIGSLNRTTRLAAHAAVLVGAPGGRVGALVG